MRKSMLLLALIMGCSMKRKSVEDAYAWAPYEDLVHQGNQVLPTSLDSITLLTSIELDKERGVVQYNYQIAVPNIDMLDGKLLKHKELSNDCAGRTAAFLNSPAQRIVHRYVAEDGREKSIEISSDECKNGVEELSWEDLKQSIAYQNKSLPVVIDEITILNEMVLEEERHRLMYQYSVDVDRIEMLDINVIKGLLLEENCSSYEELWIFSIEEVVFTYSANDSSVSEFTLIEEECKKGIAVLAWTEFEQLIAAENEDFPQKMSEQVSLIGMETNAENSSLTYLFHISIPTVTDELPNIVAVRKRYLSNGCADLQAIIGRPVQVVNFQFTTNDGSQRSTSVSAEECRIGLDEGFE